jgi:GIY-YIG catalytic domain
MEFNDLLRLVGVDPAETAVMLHAPAETALRRGLLALAYEEPALFEAYQDNHPKNAEATLSRRRHAASFVMEEGDNARFVGLYANQDGAFRSAADLDADPVRRQLQERFRKSGFVERAGETSGRVVFVLKPADGLSDLPGRLVVRRTPGRAYMRLAENNCLEIIEISRVPQFSPPAPDWRDFIVTGTEVRVLPQSWRARLREWRGIYLIIDPKDGARYVGSAYGAENLLGRWTAHVAGDAGVTVDLKGRNPEGFRFSILELLAPTSESGDVFQAETRWKLTLGTRDWGLNRN